MNPVRTIPVACGTGTADTELAAFDAALFSAGIANYNLLHLSSVIPRGCVPEVRKVDLSDTGEEGHKLYVVYAEARELVLGKEAWAGLGWVMTDEERPWGLFVEHAGASEHEVIELIEASLKSMMSYRSASFGPIQYKTAGIHCDGSPVSALVVAVYESEDWHKLH